MTEVRTVFAADDRLVIDIANQQTWADSQEISLTNREQQLLGRLATRIDVVHPKDDICKELWRRSGPKPNTNLKTHVKHVRDKLGEELGHPKQGALRTRTAIGYYLVSTLSESEIPPAEAYEVSSGFIKVDPLNQTVRIADEITPSLSPIEFNIFDMLASQAGTTVSHNDLYLKSWGKNSLLGMESLKVVVGRLRKKLGPVYGDPKQGILRNERNVGYFLLSKD